MSFFQIQVCLHFQTLVLVILFQAKEPFWKQDIACTSVLPQQQSRRILISSISWMGEPKHPGLGHFSLMLKSFLYLSLANLCKLMQCEIWIKSSEEQIQQMGNLLSDLVSIITFLLSFPLQEILLQWRKTNLFKTCMYFLMCKRSAVLQHRRGGSGVWTYYIHCTRNKLCICPASTGWKYGPSAAAEAPASAFWLGPPQPSAIHQMQRCLQSTWSCLCVNMAHPFAGQLIKVVLTTEKKSSSSLSILAFWEFKVYSLSFFTMGRLLLS